MAVPQPPHSLLFLLLLLAVSTALPFAASIDTLSVNQSIRGDQSLVSAGGAFRLGFFSPGEPNQRYLAIWYNNIPTHTAVWIANRATPLPDSGGSLVLTANGSLVLTNDTGGAHWSTAGTTSLIVSQLMVKLLNSGNLVVQDGSGRVVWQSFDHPTDTILPGMKLGRDLRTGLDRGCTGWLSTSNPWPGPYVMDFDVRGVPQVFLHSSSRNIWRSGPWNGQRFSGIPEMSSYSMFWFEYASNVNEVYYIYHVFDPSVISRLWVTPNGQAQRDVWVSSAAAWNTIWYAPKDPCDSVNPCGPFGLCNPNDSPSCTCLQGFKPKSPAEWNLRDARDGCMRETALDCRNGTDGFVTVSGAKLPDTSNATVDYEMSSDQCRSACLGNCSCTAYAVANITSNGGCIIWVSDLTDIKLYTNGGQNLYVRLAAEDLGSESSALHKTKILIGILVCVLICALLIGWGGYLQWKKKMMNKNKAGWRMDSGKASMNKYHGADATVGTEMELPLFEFQTMLVVTNYFAHENKLGEGGFGPVYKGNLIDGREVAIKRLGRHSIQGTDEFKNEVMLIAKLQHRNLVRLLGCCIEGEERMLIYEYMSNGSLDALLFDRKGGNVLDWKSRYQIIMGIARGLLYLHEDSRFRIIHRDLKASNILLDAEMNPKISDFGMARIFGGNETEVNTRRVVGTYGYMSPEYAMDGVFSVKSDVFSFGVLILEIISGTRNRGIFLSEPQKSLVGHTWNLWKEGKSLEIVDKSMQRPFPISEVLKCIKLGLLCVQERPENRPTMSSVVLMLGSDNASFPQPRQPGFVMVRGPMEMYSSSGKHETCSVNEITMTTSFEGR